MGTIDPPSSARQFTISKMIRMFFLGPSADAGILFVLPLAGFQLPDRLADAFLVGGVGEMGAEGTAAVIRPVGISRTRAALAIDAGPPRGEPGEVTAKDLGVIGWITELDERGGSRSALLARAPVYACCQAVSVGNRARPAEPGWRAAVLDERATSTSFAGE